MTFKINGIPFLTNPSNHKWADRNVLGYDGNGHPVYVAPRQFEFSFDWVDAETFSQLVGFYQATSGTCSVDLPKWNSPTGGFATYSATLQEPTYANSFEGNYGSVRFLILNVR
jgi:hypothetical protein